MHAIGDCSDFEDDVVDGTNHERGPCAANAARLGDETGESGSSIGGHGARWISREVRCAERFVVPIGILELICVAAYVIPQTSVLGAILLTGLLGGATVTTLRIGDPTFPLPVVLGMMAWGGLYLRDLRLRELIPLRKM